MVVFGALGFIMADYLGRWVVDEAGESLKGGSGERRGGT
jgi:hypothetical protein